MKCPECDSEVGEIGYKRFKCPQCNSTIVNSIEGPKGIAKPKKHGVIRGDRRKIIPKEGPRELLNVHCVGCGEQVDPATSRTGSIIRGLRFMTQRLNKTSPIIRTLIGEIITPWRTYPLQTIEGGKSYSVDRKIGFFERSKGSLCEECSANYHHITDSSGTIHPIVKVDPLPGTIGYRKCPQFDPTFGGVSCDSTKATHLINEETRKDHHSDNNWLNVGRRHTMR